MNLKNSQVEQRVNGITLAVNDLNKSREFYRKLGWDESSASNYEIAFFDVNGLVMSLYPTSEFLADQGLESESLFSTSKTSYALSQRSKDQVDEVLKIAKIAGALKIVAARDRAWGGRSGYFTDPDGHIWEVLWNPNFDLDGTGKTILPPKSGIRSL